MPNTISTRTPHAGSDMYDNRQMHVDKAFQPALPMRGVTRACARGCIAMRISTRTPHAGSDATAVRLVVEGGGFQPALPMRGVTRSLRL